jgi:hypothetical protein
MPKDETELQGQVFVIEGSTFMLVPEGIDVEKIAAEHGGDLVGHFPDAEILDSKVHAIRRATPEELAELGG